MAFTIFNYNGLGPHKQSIYELGMAIQAIYYNNVGIATRLNNLLGTTTRQWTFQQTALPPSFAIFEQNEGFVIAFAGTVNWQQWVAHTAGFTGEFAAEYGCVCHSLWLRIWRNMKNQIRNALPANLTGKRLCLTGHSYGAGLLNFMSQDYINLIGADNVDLVTFASPRVAAWEAAWLAPARHWRMENENDLVISLPENRSAWWLGHAQPGGIGMGAAVTWSHNGQGVRLTRRGGFVLNSDASLDNHLNFVTATASMQNHALEQYLERLDLSFTADDNTSNTIPLRQIDQDLRKNPVVVPGNQNFNAINYIDINDVNLRSFLNAATQVNNQNVNAIKSVKTQSDAYLRAFTSNIGFTQGLNSNMAVIRCTFMFRAPDYGWSETIYNNANTLAAARTQAKTLGDKRFLLLGNPSGNINNPKLISGSAKLDGIRVSDDSIKGDSLVEVYGPSSGFSNGFGVPCDPMQTCLLVRLEAGTLHRRSLYLAGLPDDYVEDGQWKGAAMFTTRFDAWATELKNGSWGIFARDKAATKYVISNAVYTTNWSITTTGNHGLQSGDYVQISECAAPTELNGKHRVVVTSATTFEPIGTFTGGTFSGFGKVQKISKTFVPFDSVEIVRIANRQRGKGYSGPRGRARKKK